MRQRMKMDCMVVDTATYLSVGLPSPVLRTSKLRRELGSQVNSSARVLSIFLHISVMTPLPIFWLSYPYSFLFFTSSLLPI
jgi:hypothetical protein